MTDTPKDNVVPETEMSRRRQVLKTTEEASEVIRMLVRAINELHELGVPAHEWLDMVFNAKDYGQRIATVVNRLGHWIAPAVDGMIEYYKAAKSGEPVDTTKLVMEAAPAIFAGRYNPRPMTAERDADEAEQAAVEYNRPPMLELIFRLFRDAPKLTGIDGKEDESQMPAVQCYVLLRGSIQPLVGSLSMTPEGTFRMLTPATIDGRKVLAESFFAFEDVTSVMVERPVTAEQSRIFTPGSRS